MKYLQKQFKGGFYGRYCYFESEGEIMVIKKPTEKEKAKHDEIVKNSKQDKLEKYDSYIVGEGDEVEVLSMDGVFDTLKKRAKAFNDDKSKAMDPFSDGYAGEGLVRPPYNLESLSRLLEVETYHSRCVEQKATDTVGLGFEFERVDEKVKNDSQAKAIAEFIMSAPEAGRTFTDVLNAVASDYWALMNAAMEVGRNQKGVPSLIAHVPFKTLRFHKDRKRLCQIVNGKKVWFKRFGVPENYDYKTGELTSNTANYCSELMIFQKISSINSYYGVPTTVAAMGAILALNSVKEYNLNFFEYGGLPEYGIILKNVKMTPALRRVIRTYFRSEMKMKPHRALVLNLNKMEGTEGDAEVKFEPLTKEQKEFSFERFRKAMIQEVLVSHNMSPYHLGIAEAGSMGENVAEATLENYVDSVSEPAQRLFEEKLDILFRTFIRKKMGQLIAWVLKFKNIELVDKMTVARAMPKLIDSLVITINQAKQWLGLPPAGKWADHYYIRDPQLGFVRVDPDDENAPAVNIPTGDLAKALHEIKNFKIKQEFSELKKLPE